MTPLDQVSAQREDYEIDISEGEDVDVSEDRLPIGGEWSECTVCFCGRELEDGRVVAAVVDIMV